MSIGNCNTIPRIPTILSIAGFTIACRSTSPSPNSFVTLLTIPSKALTGAFIKLPNNLFAPPTIPSSLNPTMNASI